MGASTSITNAPAAGAPLVLLHGVLGTIESCFDELRPRLARHFEVIAVEKVNAPVRT